jgi:hypothetical protein
MLVYELLEQKDLNGQVLASFDIRLEFTACYWGTGEHVERIFATKVNSSNKSGFDKETLWLLFGFRLSWQSRSESGLHVRSHNINSIDCICTLGLWRQADGNTKDTS